MADGGGLSTRGEKGSRLNRRVRTYGGVELRLEARGQIKGKGKRGRPAQVSPAAMAVRGSSHDKYVRGRMEERVPKLARAASA
jgi:hypothetical protein